MATDTFLAHAAQIDETVHKMVALERSYGQIIMVLANQKAELRKRVLDLESIVPKRMIVNGKAYVWHCPDDLIPVTDL